MSPYLKKYFLEEIACFRVGFHEKRDFAKAWRHLERAHILGQFHVGPHLLVHWYMIIFALKARDWKEILGQIPRLMLAAPGSFFHRAPVGNTGGSNVGIFRTMKIPEDLQDILNNS